jgi:hypothetical protein
MSDPEPLLAALSPVQAYVEVQAGIILGVPESQYFRRFEVRGTLTTDELRLRLADRMTEAYYYAGQLPFPHLLAWVNIHCMLL